MNPKVPIVVVCSLLFLAIGVGAGVFGMTFFGYQTSPRVTDTPPPPLIPPGGMMGGPPGGMMGGPPGGMIGGKGGPGIQGKGKGPSSKSQLAGLVDKLDLLTAKPPMLSLSGDDRAKLLEQLKGLDEAEEISEEDAKSRLDAALEILNDDKATLEAVGYRWPGTPFGGGAKGEAANPFKDDKTGQSLKSLTSTLSKK